MAPASNHRYVRLLLAYRHMPVCSFAMPDAALSASSGRSLSVAGDLDCPIKDARKQPVQLRSTVKLILAAFSNRDFQTGFHTVCEGRKPAE